MLPVNVLITVTNLSYYFLNILLLKYSASQYTDHLHSVQPGTLGTTGTAGTLGTAATAVIAVTAGVSYY